MHPPFTLALAAATLLATAACQTYSAQVVDLSRHSEAVLGRRLDDPQLVALARRIHQPNATAFDVANGVSLPEGEVVALFYNPELRVARMRLGVARATAATAGAWEDPTLAVDGERILAGISSPWIVSGTLGLTLPVSGRLAAERERAGVAVGQELARVAAREWSIRAELRRAWLDWSSVALRAASVRDLLERLDRLIEVVGRLEQAGEYRAVDARVLRIERASRSTELDKLATEAAIGRLGILRLMGLAANAPVELVEQPAYAITAMSPADRATALLTRSPELAVLRAQHALAEAVLRREIRGQYPDVQIGPGAKYEDSDARLLLGVSLPLPLWNRNRQGVAEATAERDVVRAELESAFERLTADLAAAELQVRAATALRARLESTVVPLVDQQEADVRRLAQTDRIDPLLLLDALTRRHAAAERVVEARLDEARAAARLDELIGPPIPVAAPVAK